MRDVSNNLQKVRYGQGAQTIRLVPIDRAGRPVRVASATFVIADVNEGEDSSDREIASGSASLSAVNTTLSVAAGAGEPNPRLMALTSAVGVTEGRRYLVSTPAGRALVTVDNVTGSAVTIKDTPSVAFPSGSLFQSIELEATFPALEANDSEAIDDLRDYQCTWSYTLQGEQWVTAQMVWLVRYSGEAWVTEDEVVRRWPTMPDRIRGRVRITDAITVATEDLIAELESAGVRAEYYRTAVPGMVAVCYRAIEYCLRWCGTEEDTSTAELFQSRFEKLVGNFITGKPGTAQRIEPQDDTAISAQIDGLFIRG